MRILSGIQPSGALHIGNYFGMMRPAIELQKEGETFYFIAEYHALTSLRDPKQLRENSRCVAIDFIACGLDPECGALFRQTDVPQVTELAWILSTVAPMGLLERAHSYKDKLARGIAPTVGLFSYPILMAADILIYDSDIVPVGKDQKQHIEITRDLAVKINETYGGEILKLPEPRLYESVEYLPYGIPVAGKRDVVHSPYAPEKYVHVGGFPPETSVIDPYTGKIFLVPGTDAKKMSKSYGNTIDIFGEEKETRKRVMSIVTDSAPVEASKDPTRSTIFQLFSLVGSKEEIAEMRQRFEKGGTGYGEFKKQLFEKLWEYFAPMRKRREELTANKSYIDKVLARGAERANEVADQVMQRVRKAVGLR